MADFGENFGGAGDGDAGSYNVSPQKRKPQWESSEASLAKKLSTGKESHEQNSPKKPANSFSMSIGKPLSKTGNGVAGLKPVSKSGISMNIGGMKKSSTAPIKMTLGATSKDVPPAVKPPTPKVASVFGADSDSEEEMPAEAKMRMRNKGKETPTAAGPNSFGKGNMGFCDRTKMIERELKKQMEEFGEKADGK